MQFIRYFTEIIGACLQVFCGFQKKKKNLLKWQIADNATGAVANLFAGAWISVISRTVALIRDIFVIRLKDEKIRKLIPSILVVIGLGISIFTSDHDIYGYIAIICNFIYSLFITATTAEHRIAGIKTMQSVSRFAWAVYHFRKNMYVFAVSDVLTACAAILALIAISRCRQSKKKFETR